MVAQHAFFMYKNLFHRGLSVVLLFKCSHLSIRLGQYVIVLGEDASSNEASFG